MKKMMALLLALLAVIGLCACGETAVEAMYIEPAQLTEKEAGIADLLDREARQYIFDFSGGDSVQSVQFRVYQLADETWEPTSGGGNLAFSDSGGRLFLDFDDLRAGLRAVLQSESSSDVISYAKDTGAEPEGGDIGWGTSVLCNRVEAAYGAEIPLVLQAFTQEDALTLYSPEEAFAHPEEHGRQWCDAYLVTVSFSRDPLA